MNGGIRRFALAMGLIATAMLAAQAFAPDAEAEDVGATATPEPLVVAKSAAKPPPPAKGAKAKADKAQAPLPPQRGAPTQLPELPGVTYEELHQRVQGYLAAEEIILNRGKGRRAGDFKPFAFNHAEHLDFAEEGCGLCHHKAEAGAGPRTCDTSGCHNQGGPIEDDPESIWAHSMSADRTPGSGVGCVGCHDDMGAETDCESCHEQR